MQKLIKIISCALLLVLQLTVLGQSAQDRALARQFYQDGNYAEAATFFEKLLKDAPGDNYYYSTLFKCYEYLEDFKSAEKLVKKQIKFKKNEPRYIAELGYVYKLQGDRVAMQKQYEEAIESLPQSKSLINNLAYTFRKYGEEELVIQTYEAGSKVLKNNQTFSYELAKAYDDQGKAEKAIEQYLFYVESNPRNLQRVKNSVQRSKNKGKMLDALEVQLIEKIQKNSRESIWPETLIWSYLQRKKYGDAFNQAKALDKRYEENGFRLIEIGRLATNAKDYDPAFSAYQYVVDKGRSASLYRTAKTELLKARKQEIDESANPTAESIEILKNNYETYIEEFGVNVAAVPTMLQLAELKALYQQKIDEALTLLGTIIEIPGIAPQDRAKGKLMMGDYYVISGEVWEATLLYAQVDKEFKDGPLGEEARFRNARLSYYKGEFEWAQAQLKVLKGSTTELIANDALDLSIFLIDNLGLDTVIEPMQMFADAELLMFQNKDEIAKQKLDSIQFLFPDHKLTDDILFVKAKLHVKRQEYAEAVQKLNQILISYGTDLLGDNAQFMLGDLYENQLNDLEKAQEAYKNILFNYTDSVFAVEARKRFRRLRGDAI